MQALAPILLASALLLAPVSSQAATWEEQRADLEFVRDQHLPKSLAYAMEDRRAAASLIEATIARGERLSDESFLLTLLRVAALSRNAHEGVHGGPLPSTRLPIRMIWFSDSLVVARASQEYQALLGARVERIEGLAPDELLSALRPYSGGTNEYVRWNSLWLVELGGMLHAAGVARDPQGLALRIRRRDGSMEDVRLPFVSRAAAASGASPPRLWSSAAYASERAHGWRSALKDNVQPLYLQEDEEPFRIVRLPERDALYVQFRANSTADAGGKDIQAFVASVRAAVASLKPRNLVLDLRFDIGGDIDQTRGLARELVGAVPGRLFVLIGPYTFSAGIVFAAAMKREGEGRVMLVGDTVGDRLRFWSEGRQVCLPRSAICLRQSDGLWDLIAGCGTHPNCYGDRLDARVDSLEPEVRAPITSAAWLSGRDPGMEAIEPTLRSTAIR